MSVAWAMMSGDARRRRPPARIRGHRPRVGRRRRATRRRTLSARPTSAGTAPPARRGRSASRSAPRTSSPRHPRASTLCGYSMGGRLALHVALAAPERIGRLVLVSATAGIEDEADRARRRAADERLAAEIERMPTRGLRGSLARAAAVRGRCRSGPHARPRRTSCATTPRASPRRCAASARGRCRRCGTGSASWRASTRSSSQASATPSTCTSASGWRPRSRARGSRSSRAGGMRCRASARPSSRS